MTRISVITDMDFTGSGYLYLMTPLLTELAKMGHEIKVAGLTYQGMEHNFPFSIIPARDVQETANIVTNLFYVWQSEVTLVGLDIPIQLHLFEALKQFQKPYIAITPLENGPLTMSWAAGLFNFNYVFFISELGKQEAMKSGLQRVEHLKIGVDTQSWRPALPDERVQIRKGLGIADDEFVVLTVADNQERKNLSAAMQIVANLKEEIGEKKVRYLLVTRENSQFGWKLRDLAVWLHINEQVTIFERGMPRDRLWGLYAVADAYLATSKAEGLGLPVLDAMAAGVPVVATDTGAMHELLYGTPSRGYLIPSAFRFIDVWGNSYRDMIHVESAVKTLKGIMDGTVSPTIMSALDYVRTRTWDIPAKQIHDVITRLTGEKNV